MQCYICFGFAIVEQIAANMVGLVSLPVAACNTFWDRISQCYNIHVHSWSSLCALCTFKGAEVNHRGRIIRKSDTNILAVKFNQLIEPSHVHTGDPVVCRNASCSAVLSHLSSVGKQEDKDEMVRIYSASVPQNGGRFPPDLVFFCADSACFRFLCLCACSLSNFCADSTCPLPSPSPLPTAPLPPSSGCVNSVESAMKWMRYVRNCPQRWTPLSSFFQRPQWRVGLEWAWPVSRRRSWCSALTYRAACVSPQRSECK